MTRFWKLKAFWAGLFLVLAYWVSVHPPQLSRGSIEDWCQFDQTRQIMAENLAEFGRPYFRTRSYGAPEGLSIPYMPWSMEMSWLGGWVWRLSPEIPFQWLYFGLSLAATYLGVGYILSRMRMSTAAAWGLAAFVTVFHAPRHFKIWHHYEHLLQHWVYWGIFLDAWIWQRFTRDRRWSINLELWRGLVLLGTVGTAGYFWGPMVIEWLVVRLFMLRGRRGLTVEWARSRAWLPVGLGLVLAALDLRWFLPLVEEARKAGMIQQKMGWFGKGKDVVTPLWPIGRFGYVLTSETLMCVGWMLWLPALGAMRAARGFRVYGPFAVLLLVALVYGLAEPPVLQWGLQAILPLFRFFRAASRWGLFMPQILAAILALCWPELTARARTLWAGKRAWVRVAAAVFVVSSLAEAAMFLTPVNNTEPLGPRTLAMLERLRQAPGTTVLDLPFCQASGNAGCTSDNCPNYPASTAGACLRMWHGKKVYGLYASRFVDSQCDLYRQAPYSDWTQAWRENRCLRGEEWDQLCRYLGEHPELSAVLVYPEIWFGGDASCVREFEQHLGPARAEGIVPTAAKRVDLPGPSSRVLWFEPRCRQ